MTWFTVFTYELNRNIRRKGFLFATFVLPILIFALMNVYNLIASNSQSEEDPNALEELLSFDIDHAGYVDQAGIIKEIPDSLQSLFVAFPDVDSARTALLAGELDVFYDIAPNFTETALVTIHIAGLELNALNAGPIEQLIYSNLAPEVDQLTIARLRSSITFQEVNLKRVADNAEAPTGDTEMADFITLYGFIIVFLMGIFLTNSYLMQSVIEEKESRLIEVIISSVKPINLLLGKILALGLMGMMQVVVWVTAIVVIVKYGGTLDSLSGLGLNSIILPIDRFPLMFLYFVLGYLFFAALYGAVGAISTSMNEGPQFAVIFTLPAAVPFYFFPLFIASPDAPIPVAFSMFPITAPIAMMMRLTLGTVPVWQIGLSALLLVISIYGAVWVAGRLFRVQTLLSGQTPKLRDIPKLIFS